MKNNGSILVELLVAFTIGSFVIATVFTVFNQVNKAFLLTSEIVSLDTPAALLQHQLEVDLSGAFVPNTRKPKKSDEKEKPKVRKKQEKLKPEEKKSKEPKQKYKDLPLKNAFESKNKGPMLESLTFVTTNPLPAYNEAKPRIARVLYKLVEDKKRKSGDPKTFKLMRRESPKLDVASVSKKDVIAYEVVKNIKSLSVEYTVAVVKGGEDEGKEKQDEEGKKKVKKAPPKERKVEYKTFKKWAKKEIEDTKKQKPDLCIFKISLFDRLKKQTQDFEFKIYIVDTKPVVKDKKEPEPKKEKEPKKQNEAIPPSEETLKSVRLMLRSPFGEILQVGNQGNQRHRKS